LSFSTNKENILMRSKLCTLLMMVFMVFMPPMAVAAVDHSDSYENASFTMDVPSCDELRVAIDSAGPLSGPVEPAFANVDAVTEQPAFSTLITKPGIAGQ
jgi:hypothetical protein